MNLISRATTKEKHEVKNKLHSYQGSREFVNDIMYINCSNNMVVHIGFCMCCLIASLCHNAVPIIGSKLTR